MEGYIEKEILINGIKMNVLVNEKEYFNKIEYQSCSDDFHNDNKRYFDIIHTPRVLMDSEIKEAGTLIKYLDMKYEHKCNSCKNKEMCMLRLHQYTY